MTITRGRYRLGMISRSLPNILSCQLKEQEEVKSPSATVWISWIFGIFLTVVKHWPVHFLRLYPASVARFHEKSTSSCTSQYWVIFRLGCTYRIRRVGAPACSFFASERPKTASCTSQSGTELIPKRFSK